MTTTTLTAGTDQVLRIAARLNGPRDHANGGFACGTFASVARGPAAVRLLRGVPLEQDLVATPTGDERWTVHDARQRIADIATVAPFCDEPPVRPDLEDARRAREAHPFRGVRHPLSDCVVCGPDRTDGLEVTPGPVGDGVLAAPFVVKPAYADGGLATTASVWGALDCVSFPAALVARWQLALLGELAADVRRRPAVGEQLVAVGWTTGAGRRSHRTASALLDERGEIVASGRAVWVEVPA